ATKTGNPLRASGFQFVPATGTGISWRSRRIGKYRYGDRCWGCLRARTILLDRPGGDLRSRGEAKLAQDGRHMRLDRPLGDEELIRDLPVRQASRHQARNLFFPTGQAPAAGLALLAISGRKLAQRPGEVPGPIVAGQERVCHLRDEIAGDVALLESIITSTERFEHAD